MYKIQSAIFWKTPLQLQIKYGFWRSVSYFPYEDPAGLAIGTKLEINLGVQKEALKSAHQASVVLNIAYGGTKGVVNILKRLDQLSIMALTGSASDSDRKLIDLEAQQLKAEVNRISTATEFNGRKLIDGSTC